MAAVTRCGSLVVAIVAVVVGACTPDRGPRFRAAGATRPVAGGTLHLAFTNPIVSLDPMIGGGDETSSNALHEMFDTLVDFAPGGLEIEPRLARDFHVSADGLVYSFRLRDGITYADGTSIVAADFKYALERALASHECGGRGTLADVVGAPEMLAGKATTAAGIVVVDDRTLELHLATKNAAFLDVLTMSFTTPMRKAWVDAAGDDIRRRPLATGPYMLERWDEGRRLVLVKNPRHYDRKRGRIARIDILEHVDRTAQFLMFESGELDAIDHMSPPDLLWIASQPDWLPYIHRVPLMTTFGSRMNVTLEPFVDVRVRRAFNYAINKDHTTKLLAGTTVPSHGVLPPNMLGRDNDVEPYRHDARTARALLAEAGYPDGLDVDYIMVSDDEARRVAASLQSDLAEVGVRVHLVSVDSTAWIAAQNDSKVPFTQAGWTVDYPDPINFLDQLFSTAAIGDTNSTHYSNPKLDALLATARGEEDPQRRASLYREAERIVHDDAPWIWNYHQQLVEVTQPYVRDYHPHPVWQRDYSYAWLDLDSDGHRVKAR